MPETNLDRLVAKVDKLTDDLQRSDLHSLLASLQSEQLPQDVVPNLFDNTPKAVIEMIGFNSTILYGNRVFRPRLLNGWLGSQNTRPAYKKAVEAPIGSITGIVVSGHVIPLITVKDSGLVEISQALDLQVPNGVLSKAAISKALELSHGKTRRMIIEDETPGNMLLRVLEG